MSALSHLTLSNKTRTARLTHPERRREKLLAMLRHQAELVKAELRGAEYVAIYRKWALDDRGIRRQFERQRRVRPWYWESGDGQWHINVRYGAAIVSLAPGKTSVTVGRKEQLPAVFETLMPKGRPHSPKVGGAATGAALWRSRQAWPGWHNICGLLQPRCPCWQLLD